MNDQEPLETSDVATPISDVLINESYSEIS